MIVLLLINLAVLICIVMLLYKHSTSIRHILKELALFEFGWLGLLSTLSLFLLFDILERKEADQSFYNAVDANGILYFTTLALFTIVHLVILTMIGKKIFNTNIN